MLKKRSRETVAGPWKTVSVLILVPIFMSFISISLFCSGIDIVDMKIGTRINTETVFQGPETVSLDLFFYGHHHRATTVRSMWSVLVLLTCL